MRAIIQRVKESSVSIDGKEISHIDKGQMVLLGVSTEDSLEDASYIASKIANLRIFDDDEGKMNLSVKDVGGSLLIVSQFTLYGDARKGRRPSFIQAAGGDKARKLYEEVVRLVQAEGIETQTGEFGADMDVYIINDGPVTIQLDSTKTY